MLLNHLCNQIKKKKYHQSQSLCFSQEHLQGVQGLHGIDVDHEGILHEFSKIKVITCRYFLISLSRWFGQATS